MCGCQNINGLGEVVKPASKTCQGLIDLYKGWKTLYGAEKAKKDIVTYWVTLPSFQYIPFFGNPIKAECMYDVNFINYFKGEGIDFSTAAGKIITTPISVVSSVFDGAENLVSNVTDATTRLTGTAKWVLPVTLIGVAGIALTILYAKTKELTT